MNTATSLQPNTSLHTYRRKLKTSFNPQTSEEFRLKPTFLGLTPKLTPREQINNEGVRQKMLKAVQTGNVQELERMLRAGANPNLTDNKGNTILHHIASLVVDKGNANLSAAMTKMVKILVEYHADMNTPNHLGETPILTAYKNKNLGVAEELCKSGASLNVCDNNKLDIGDVISRIQDVKTEDKDKHFKLLREHGYTPPSDKVIALPEHFAKQDNVSRDRFAMAAFGPKESNIFVNSTKRKEEERAREELKSRPSFV